MTEQTQLAVVDSTALAQSRALSGGSIQSSMPYIPVIKINQVAEEKVIDVEGVPTKVKLPVREGFNITDGEKDADGRFISNFFAETFRGVILHERYKIKSKWKVEPAFYSKEFSNFFEPIVVYNGTNQAAKGTYRELKEIFQTAEMDSSGKHKKSFDLILVLYIWMPDVDKIVKFEYKMSGQNKWFDYKASFGDNSHYTTCITEFSLRLERAGTNEFYVADYVSKEAVDLNEIIKRQIQLKEYLEIKYGKPQTFIENYSQGESQEPVIQIEAPAYDQPEDDEISIDDIPF